jgi:hypothetical protein
LRLPVTQRYLDAVGDAPAVTLRYLPAADPLSTASQPAPGHVIGAGYRIEQGPLQPSSGEGDVYRCRLHGQGEPLILKLYRGQLRPDPQVMAQLLGLSHPNIVRILDQGQWQGRFYEVMDYCAGGNLLDALPCNEYQLRDLLAQVVAGLDYCHRRGIVHCDIKPANLFFADAQRHRLCIGDFGISAHARDLESTHITRNQGDLTLDYSAPELVEGNQASPKSDYYALGISLLHLLQGASPFAGKRPGEIIAHHLRGRIPLPPHLSEAMDMLIRGLTEFDADRRWGYRQVMAFLHGDLAQLNVDRYRRRADKAYPGYPRAHDCLTLANNLHRFDALQQLKDGAIGRWLFDQVDADLAEALKPVEQLARQSGYGKAEQALLQLTYLLNPFQPLQLAGQSLKTLAELVSVLATRPETLIPVWRNGALALWIRSGRLAGEQTDQLEQRIAELAARHEAAHTALQALLYHLDPQRPFVLWPGLHLRHPGQLRQALQQHQQHTLAGLRQTLFNQLFEEWLRAAEFDHWQAACQFIARLRRDYADQHQLGAYALLWHFVPNLSLPFAGQAIRDPQVLVSLVEASAKNRQEAMQLLLQGWLRAWLVGSGKADPGVLDQLLLALDMTPEAKLEALLQSLSPGLEAPRLQVEPGLLTFSVMEMDDLRQRDVVIRNVGRGHLHGRILLEHYGQGIRLDHFNIEGNETRIAVTLDGQGLTPGQYHNRLRLLTNAGEHLLPISFYIKEPADTRSWWERLTE